MKELEAEIIEILGYSALDNNMEVPEDVQKLARATRYLATQLVLNCADEDVTVPILKTAINILKG